MFDKLVNVLIVMALILLGISFLPELEEEPSGITIVVENSSTLEEPPVDYDSESVVVREIVSDPWYSGEFELEIRDEEFRIVCETDCPTEADFDNIYENVKRLNGYLMEITGVGLKTSQSPFEVHVTPDSLCNNFAASTRAYAGGFNLGEKSHGLLCLDGKFLVPDDVTLHELTHLYQFDRFPFSDNIDLVIVEGFADITGALASPANVDKTFCWDKNSIDAINDNTFVNFKYAQGKELFYQLCQKYGFDVEDLPQFFAGIDSWGRVVTKDEFIAIINAIVEGDTTTEFTEYTGYTPN